MSRLLYTVVTLDGVEHRGEYVGAQDGKMSSAEAAAESVSLWTWCVYIDGYPWTDGGTALKAWRTKEQAEADARKEWGDDVDVTAMRIALIDGQVAESEGGLADA